MSRRTRGRASHSAAVQRTGIQLPAAGECTKRQPADARRTHPGPGRPAGWEARQAGRRRPVSCNALLGGVRRTAIVEKEGARTLNKVAGKLLTLNGEGTRRCFEGKRRL